jgi:aromatic-amino-acid transaminase
MSESKVSQHADQESAPKLEGDPVLAIMELYNQDQRPEKVDLGVGVFKDEQGRTPVLPSVKTAERRLIETEDSKTYLGLAANQDFSAALARVVFGSELADGGNVCALQSVGGSGALRLTYEFAMQCAGIKRLHVSTPTWENQAGIAMATGLSIERYPYYDVTSGAVDIDSMLACVSTLGPTDAVLIHGVCHNPTGADLTLPQWESLALSASNQGWLPIIDFAYPGFGQSIEQDAAGVCAMIKRVPTSLLALSCSKIFGLYRERVGSVYVFTESSEHAENAMAQLMRIAREIYSMPPDHGAAVVQMILNDPDLCTQWQAELASMRDRLNAMRALLSDELCRCDPDGSDRYQRLTQQHGMFSLLDLSVTQVRRLRDEYAIYLIEDGRINVAGLTPENAPRVASALVAVA